MRRASMIAALLGLALLLPACTAYSYVVRTDGAPLYADPHRSEIIARMKRLHGGDIGHSAPKGNPVEIEYEGLEGYADREDLRIFAYPDDEYARFEAFFHNRREVVLEGKDWPARFKQAVRESRVESGMTKEMVELAWGRPSSVQPLEGGGERWTYERTGYEVREDVVYDWHGGRTRFFYACPYGWSYVHEFPYYEPVYYRSYYPRTFRKSATFGAAGTVVGWESGQW